MKRMKREIKFRFFDKSLNRILYRHLEKYDVEHPDIEVMQYTGLKDKNGKEIYEGDIISHDNGFYKMFENREVKFWEGAFVAGRCTANDALVSFNCQMCVEVIGNIYVK